MDGRVLVVDDDADMCRLLDAALSQRGFGVTWTTSAAEVIDRLGRDAAEAVVTDISMAGMSGLELCERITADRPDVPVIVLTAFGNLEMAVGAIRAGAYDFLTKPPDPEALALALGRAVTHGRLRCEVKRLSRAVEAARGFGELIGTSPSMLRVYDLLERVAGSDASVLISGESGTGKELVARALHRQGARSAGPFVAVNCAAVPEALLESELFGHVRGAFTDARGDRRGLFLQAHRGTLFLDEIGDLPPALQPKLLRVLQERMVRPLGADTELACDVRVTAASNRDLELELERGRFREDLYYRLNVIRVPMPPLRERGNDVLLLAQHFIARIAAQAGKKVQGLSAKAAELLQRYPWPGNVRELQNCIERAVVLTRHAQNVVDDLPEKVRACRQARVVNGNGDATELVRLEEVEQRYILQVLETVLGNRTRAAEILGVDRKTLYRKLEQYGAV
jgi:two-component system response regulator AtoC